MFSGLRKKSTWIFLVVMVSILSLLVGCGADKAAQDKEKSGKKVIGLSISTLNNPFFVDLKDGAQAAAKELGIELVVMDAQNDASKQMANIENLVQQKVSVLIVNPVDSKAVVPAIEAANKANIPVITVDRGAEGGKIVSAIASDNVAGGKMAAKLLIDKLGGKGKVIELEGIPGSSAANDRGKGFDDEIKNATGITLLAKQPADFDRAKGMKVMENLLQANPEIQAVFAQNDEMALGAMEAIKAVKRDVLIVGFDATADAVKAVNNGDMLATVAQKPKDMGKVSIETAQKIMNGETVPESIPVELELIVKK